MKSMKLVLRFAVIGALVLALLVPLAMIRGVVHEREQYRAQAVERVAQGRAGEQRLVGPLRVVPWTERREVAERAADGSQRLVTREVNGHLLQAPVRLDVQGTLQPAERRVGLFRIPVYGWQAQAVASFTPLDYPAVDGRAYGQPYLAIGIADVRGLVGAPQLVVDGRPLALASGTRDLAALSGGVHAALPQAGATGLPALREVHFDATIDGTRSLAIVPVADDNRIDLASPWLHPQFGGRFLPTRRDIDADGFRAHWALSSLASDAQAQLRRGEADALDALQVSLVDPVDVYTQVDRATKYGLLFVLLTFVAFGLFELIKRLPIHPLQYLLVGLALAIFFLLLLSLSEHIAFHWAYLVSATACIGVQAMYLSGVLRSWRRGLGFAAMLTALYGALYCLLVSEDNALLMGSLLLFGILAAVMWITRKVDWYALGNDVR
ncbi:cell envelope integrity protein CreD [Luteimonas yindakuii]|uniref:Cell envelope integrity protein CreD n=1 Tax=Luteimonas yindakuii TaxID=2565782 RepID=A0A4Z1RL67_9GAMM|nr:cell envelope integrity protein CreD [Luteimonas yindakuii]TKS54361.1 cell envelope integrity protein CreD [Luteimonas yindakuii]